jgi:hypothetical protein
MQEPVRSNIAGRHPLASQLLGGPQLQPVQSNPLPRRPATLPLHQCGTGTARRCIFV